MGDAGGVVSLRPRRVFYEAKPDAIGSEDGGILVKRLATALMARKRHYIEREQAERETQM